MMLTSVLEPAGTEEAAHVGNTALSRGEWVDRDGAFASRRGTGEGLLPAPSGLILPRSARAAALPPCTFQPNTSPRERAAQPHVTDFVFRVR